LKETGSAASFTRGLRGPTLYEVDRREAPVPVHCPECDAVLDPPVDAVEIMEDGVRVEPFDCPTCGAEDLLPTDLIPGSTQSV